MTFIPKKTKTSQKFNLHNAEDILAYNNLLNDPAIKIVEKHIEKIKNTTVERDGNAMTSAETEEIHCYVEYEECGL